MIGNILASDLEDWFFMDSSVLLCVGCFGFDQLSFQKFRFSKCFVLQPIFGKSGDEITRKMKKGVLD